MKNRIKDLRNSGKDGATIAVEAKRLGGLKIELLEKLKSGEAVLGEGGVEVLWREIL